MQILIENKVINKVFSIVTNIVDILSQKNLLFGNLKHLIDTSIIKVKPDCYDRSRSVNLNKQIREKLSFYIVPSTNIAAPCLLNFFIKKKGPNGNIAIYKRQALYDDALNARGIHKLRLYIEPETAYDNNAYTITSIYHSDSGNLTIYSTHPTPFNNLQNSIEYRITQLRGWKITNISKTFR